MYDSLDMSSGVYGDALGHVHTLKVQELHQNKPRMHAFLRAGSLLQRFVPSLSSCTDIFTLGISNKGLSSPSHKSSSELRKQILEEVHHAPCGIF